MNANTGARIFRNSDRRWENSSVTNDSPSSVICLIIMAIPLAFVISGRFSIDNGDIFSISSSVFIVYFCGLTLIRMNFLALGHAIKIAGIFLLLSVLITLSCAVLTSTALPYTDNQLARADRYFGFHWLAMFSFIAKHPDLFAVLAHAYTSLNWEPQLIVLLLCLFRAEHAYRFLTAWALSLSITLAIYPFFPAVAAFHHYRIDPLRFADRTSAASWHLDVIMNRLRSGADNVLGYDDLTGIVTMPSFHAAAAVLLLWVSWSFRWLRGPSLALNATMFVSAVPVGAHYLVDIIAGLIIAIFAPIMASMLHRPADNKSAIERRIPGNFMAAAS